MDIDISIGKESFTINIDNPFHFDLSAVMRNVVDFGKDKGWTLRGLRSSNLSPECIRGVAGCGGWIPSDAKFKFIERASGIFNLSYVEGGN